MRIGFDAKRLFNNWTGLGAYSRTLLANLGLSFAEHEYWLYSPKMPDKPLTKPFLGSPFQPVLPQTKFRSWWRTFGLSARAGEDRLDLFHGLSNELPIGMERQGIPQVVTIHDLIFKRYPGTYNWPDRLIYEAKFRSACRRADRVIAISESTRADILAYYGPKPEKVSVIYQSCDPIFYDAPTGREKTRSILRSYDIPEEYLLYVGSIIPRKNLLTLVVALEQIPESRRLPLVVVGRGGSYRKRVADYVRKKGLEKWLKWQPNIFDTRHLKAIYEGATAFIYPSVCEGFGIPVVEAALCRTPVITSNVSSLPEAAGPHALLVDPEEVDALYAAMEHVLTSAEDMANRVEQSYRYAMQKFAPEHTTLQVMELYRELAG